MFNACNIEKWSSVGYWFGCSYIHGLVSITSTATRRASDTWGCNHVTIDRSHLHREFRENKYISVFRINICWRIMPAMVCSSQQSLDVATKFCLFFQVVARSGPFCPCSEAVFTAFVHHKRTQLLEWNQVNSHRWHLIHGVWTRLYSSGCTLHFWDRSSNSASENSVHTLFLRRKWMASHAGCAVLSDSCQWSGPTSTCCAQAMVCMDTSVVAIKAIVGKAVSQFHTLRHSMMGTIRKLSDPFRNVCVWEQFF